jgi:hypothetical protein
MILVVIAALCALLLGAAAGYAARDVSAPAGNQVHATKAIDASQGGPNSDLTRVLPTAPAADPAAGYDISQWTDGNAPQPDHGLIP